MTQTGAPILAAPEWRSAVPDADGSSEALPVGSLVDEAVALEPVRISTQPPPPPKENSRAMSAASLGSRRRGGSLIGDIKSGVLAHLHKVRLGVVVDVGVAGLLETGLHRLGGTDGGQIRGLRLLADTGEDAGLVLLLVWDKREDRCDVPAEAWYHPMWRRRGRRPGRRRGGLRGS
jgi:hypothetical protein